MSKFYITTSIAYTNAAPHIGYALELIQGDVLARYNRQKLGDGRVWYLTGTDEHGTKIARSADEAGVSPHKFVDDISGKFKILCEKLNISNDDFIRTSDQDRHWPAVNKIWNLMQEAGDLYKKEYSGYYCVGHEAFIKKSELVDGKCPIHQKEPEELKEENWFFKLFKYKDAVIDKIESGELLIVPETRKNEILNLLADAEDISFSRPAETLKWGIPVPGDPSQTIYVWADALTNYISALGWESGQKLFEKFWPADVHLIGKDILRFHAMYWPAMLLSAKLPLPKSIYVHGFVTVDGQKMSKSIGNVIDPFDLVEKYPVDAIRYFLLREIPSGDDGDFSWDKLKDRYNGELANGLGNLVQRVATLIEGMPNGELKFNVSNFLSWAEKNQISQEAIPYFINMDDHSIYESFFRNFELHKALDMVWSKIGAVNRYAEFLEPWKKKYNNPEGFLAAMTFLIRGVHHVTFALKPFMPETAQKIKEIFSLPNTKEIPENHKFLIKKGAGLFPRLD